MERGDCSLCALLNECQEPAGLEVGAVSDWQPKVVILGQRCDLQLVLLSPPSLCPGRQLKNHLAVGEQRGLAPRHGEGVHGAGVYRPLHH